MIAYTICNTNTLWNTFEDNFNLRQSVTGTQSSAEFITKPSKQTQPGVQVGEHPEVSNLSHLLGQPLSPHAEYIAFAGHVTIAKTEIKQRDYKIFKRFV